MTTRSCMSKCVPSFNSVKEKTTIVGCCNKNDCNNGQIARWDGLICYRGDSLNSESKTQMGCMSPFNTCKVYMILTF